MAACFLLAGLNAHAIEEGSFGVTAEFSTDANLFIGVAWHPLDFLDIRPHILFFYEDEEYGTAQNPSDVSGRDIYANSADLRVGGGLEALFLINIVDDLYVYVGPRVEYIFRNYERRSETVNNNNYDYTSHNIEGLIVLGGQYMFAEQFGLFGGISAGVSYQYIFWNYKSPSNLRDVIFTDLEVKTLAGRVGLVFYF